VEIKNHYSDDFINVDNKMDFSRQESIKNHNKPSKSTIAENNEQLYIKSREKINNCNTRAGGLAWLRYRLDMAGVVGSNPTRPI
jgi:GTP1/Obg family GTP-binding protein